MKPELIYGEIYSDERGKIFHINNFDLSPIKRMYSIENINKSQLRGWKGHLIENRWFYCQIGEIEIHVIQIKSMETNKPEIEKFILSDKNLNVLFVPKGYATMIRQKKIKSRILAMSDYLIDECNDDHHRWDSDFFKK